MAVTSSESTRQTLRVVEFYAGVGGWHYAIKSSGLDAVVVAAVDVNTTANEVYKYNFPDTVHWQRNICGLTSKDLDSLSADIFTLSPPCQPFTRQGNQGDDCDRRTDSFFHLMCTLPEMAHPPSYIMMENVKNFETSNTRDVFHALLQSMEYDVQEFLLSPKQLGIPNSRLRYYLLARRKPLRFTTVLSETPCCTIENWLLQKDVEVTMGVASDKVPHPPTVQLKDGFIEPLIDISEFLVPAKVLEKYAMGLDIVNEGSSSSCCFTKGYYHYAVGTGSVLQHCHGASLDAAFKNYLDSKQREDVAMEECLSHLRALQLRYFTPREVANLMCFPRSFEFPSHTTLKQRYRVLGNSVNVTVVSILLKYLLNNE